MVDTHRFLSYGRRDIAVDLGTANTVVYIRGEGVVLLEPSVVALDDVTKEVHAVGAEAKRMIGRTPARIRAIRPLRHGVIADFDVTEQMLRVVLCVPSGITGVERQAVEEATLAAGGSDVTLIEEPMAAAIGADFAVEEPTGNMIVDIGGGTTEVAVISLGGMVVWDSIRVGGYEMDEAIVRWAKKEHNLLIGQEGAEELKIDIGSATEQDGALNAEIRGRDVLTGLLKRVPVSSDDLRGALTGTVDRIVDAVRETLEKTPPELAADIMDRGLVLAGGGALLRGIDERLRRETQLSVQLVDRPLTCVAEGAGRSLVHFDVMKRAAAGQSRPSRRVHRGRRRV
ncbi:MAG: rod shape-determining protein [Actinobacteria bacterium]|nr:MAG: rod shape-determining protein [Actinomycetota bacterium]